MGVYYDCVLKKHQTLSSSSDLLDVVSSPVGSSGWSGVVSSVTLLSKTSISHTSGGKTSDFSSVVLVGGDPVDSWVSSDSVVIWVNNDNFEELRDGILSNPVGVEDSHVLASSTDLLFSDVSVGSSFLLLSDTKMDWFTINDTLVDCSLSSSSSDSASVDDISLLLFESKSSGLIESRWSSNSVHDSELSVLPASDSEHESDNIRLLSSPEFLQIFIGTHLFGFFRY